MLIHKGKEWEEKYAKDNKDVPNPDSTSNPEFKCVLQTIVDSLKVDATKWSRMAKVVRGVREETTTCVHHLKEMAKTGELLFPAINVNDFVRRWDIISDPCFFNAFFVTLAVLKTNLV